MDYSFDNVENIEILNVSGNVLTGIQNNEILDELKERISEGQSKVVVHLKDARYINSNGLTLLLNILTKCRKAGGEVVLANIPKELTNLLVITKLNSIFNTKESKEEAIDYLRSLHN